MHVYHLIPHALTLSFTEGRFKLQAGPVCNPIFQSKSLAAQPQCKLIISSQPGKTRKTPLTAALVTDLKRVSLEVVRQLKAKLKEQVLVTALLQASYLGSETCRLLRPSKNHLRQIGFSFTNRRLTTKLDKDLKILKKNWFIEIDAN